MAINPEFGQRVKELRISKGFSQELLASETGLNLRTIQRIESGESIPRGDTLNRLSKALEVSQDKIIGWNKDKDKEFLTLLNLSSLSFIIFPILGIVVPFVLWVSKKNKIENADEYGKQIINFQISIIVFVFVIALFFWLISWTIIPRIDNDFISWLGPFMGMVFPIVLYYAYNFIVIIINTIRASRNMPIKYRPKLNFIK